MGCNISLEDISQISGERSQLVMHGRVDPFTFEYIGQILHEAWVVRANHSLRVLCTYFV
jgi:hypothetical protein